MQHLTFQQISASLDEELTGVARELVERHLVGCAGCDAVMERLVRLDAELLAVISEDPGEEFFAEMLVVVRGTTESLEEAARSAGVDLAAGLSAAAPLEAVAARVEPAPAPARVPAAPAARALSPAPAPRPAPSAPAALPSRAVLRPRATHVEPGEKPRLGRAWIAAVGLLAIPMFGLLGLGLLNWAPVRALRERANPEYRAASVHDPAPRMVEDSAKLAASGESIAALEPPAPESAAADPVPAPEPVAIETPEPEPVAVVPPPVAPPPAPKPAVTPKPAAPRPARAERSEVVAVAPAGPASFIPTSGWTTRRETRITTVSTAPLPGELGMVAGEVRDFDGRPVSAAQVSVSGVEIVVLTDRDGRFLMSAPYGERTLSVTAAGFATQRVPVRVGQRTLERSVTLGAGPR